MGKPALNESLLWLSADESVAAIFDGKGHIQYEIGGAEGEGTYTYDATTGNGTITLADGSALTISVNEKNQVVVTSADGTATVLFPSMA